MRKAFIAALTELAESQPRIVLLTGDLGYGVVEPFAARFRDRFFNVGVAEQNMIGIATGLAEAGYIPFVYSIATFATLRPYEFIRNGPVAHRLPVRIVGIGGGFEYGNNGFTHYAVEDVGVMRMQPGMTVICPADDAQTAAAIERTWQLARPIYYRISKNDAPPIPTLAGRFELGRLDMLHEGSDMLIAATGAIAREALASADSLLDAGISCAVALVSSFNPAPLDELAALLSRFSLVVTLEAHYRSGGLGSVVAETIADRGLACRVIRCGVEEASEGLTGSEASLARDHGLTRERLVETVLRATGHERVKKPR